MALRALGRRPLTALPLVAVPVLLSTVLVACGNADDGAAVLTARGEAIEGATATIQLPDGQLVLTVADAAEVSAEQVSGGDPDGTYVGVDWEWEPGAGVPAGLSGFLITDDAPARVSATIDGEEHALGDRGDAAGHWVPAARGTKAGEVTVSVELDGVTQTVRGDGTGLDAGVAAPLYDLRAPTKATTCRAALTPATVRGTPQCDYGTVRLPYVHDLGWAEKGEDWLVVNLVIRLDEVRRGTETIEAGAQEETLRIGDQEPDTTLDARQVATRLQTQSVFAVPTGEAQTIDFRRTVATEGAGDLQLNGQLQEETP